MLWHVGHIAHHERAHLDQFLQGLKPPLYPPEFEVFGPDRHSVEEVRSAVKSVSRVFDWAADVRSQSRDYIAPLKPEDLFRELDFPEKGLTMTHRLFITAAHRPARGQDPTPACLGRRRTGPRLPTRQNRQLQHKSSALSPAPTPH